MRVIIAACVCLLVLAGSATAQIEKGDKEVSFSASFTTQTGTDNSNENGYVNIMIGYSVTTDIQIGVGPRVSISSGSDLTGRPGDTKITTTVGTAFFLNYNFQSGGKQIPFLRVTWDQHDWSTETGQSFTDKSYVTGGAGLRSFINDYAALNTSLTYGKSLASQGGGGLITLNTALSFIF